MTFRSLFWITLIGGSLCACVNQYTSPDGEVENTSTEPSGTSPEPSETTKPPNKAKGTPSEAKGTPSEAKGAPTETSGTCDDQTCVSTSDCCKGYQCGFDPERSKVLRYCLAQ
jgi:hypothetical protein